MSPLRILIADDHEFVRRGLRSVLETRVDFEICGEAANGEEAIQKTLELNPDVVVFDINMPVLNGLDAARTIRKLSSNTSIIFVSVHDPTEVVREAKKIGARGYVLKADAEQNLVNAVEAVVHDESFFPRN
jgi:DNA-binding NarL/FixJ family response regulator